jgi:hypothetical protein
MTFPPSYYQAAAIGSGVRYYLSMALAGSYASSMQANVPDVVAVSRKALQDAGSLATAAEQP